MGAVLYEDGCNFKVYSPEATEVYLCLFDRNEKEIARFKFTERNGPIWLGFIKGVKKDQLYGYRVAGPNDPSRGQCFDISKLLIDPYAKQLNREQIWNYSLYIGDSQKMISKSVVIDESFDWEGVEKPNYSEGQYIIYETHVRGYTKLNPKVPEKYRGTYLGMCQPAVIDHLKKIGITAVQFMPIHAHMDESRLVDLNLTNYWGYNTINFFSPEPKYAYDPMNAVNEFKEMVKTLHKNGIAVILDVVYNHTAEGGYGGPLISFRGFNNRDFYQYSKDETGSKNYTYYSNHTGCGNCVNADDVHVLNLIMNSLRYWYTEMQVDGFRFDLATTLARTEAANGYDFYASFLKMMFMDPVLSKAFLIAEPWDIGGYGYRVGQFPRNWKELNDHYRDTIRCFWKGDEGKMADFATRLLGSRDIYQKTLRSIHSSVNFVSYHDGFTLHDLVSYNYKHNEANQESNRDGQDNNNSYNYGEEGPTASVRINNKREQQKRNMLCTLLLSQGIPHFVAGDEMGRSQLGNNNAYCQDNRISWQNWDLSLEDKDLIEFISKLTRIRLSSKVFTDLSLQDDLYYGKNENYHEVQWYHADGHVLTSEDWNNPNSKLFTLDIGNFKGNGDRWLILFNASSYDIGFHLPRPNHGMKWEAMLDTTEHNGEPFALTSQSIDLLGLTKSHSIKVIKQVVDPNPIKKSVYTHRKDTKVKIGINGFGRLGRTLLRESIGRDDLEIVGINDVIAGDNNGVVTADRVEYLAYMLKYDSTHGLLNADIKVSGTKLLINNKVIRITANKEPSNLQWFDIGVEVVIEATGKFMTSKEATMHLESGAYKVILAAPAKDDETPTFVMGVNQDKYDGEEIISAASTTTSCIAPLVKIIDEKYGIESGMITSVHSYNSLQKTVDGPSQKYWRLGRGAAQNIIPSTTGASNTIAKILPSMQGKFTGISMRVPTADVSLVDLTINLKSNASYQEICNTIKTASESSYKGILSYVSDPIVSADLLGAKELCYFDEKAGLSISEKFVKLVAWYDNEVGYANKTLDLAVFVINN